MRAFLGFYFFLVVSACGSGGQVGGGGFGGIDNTNVTGRTFSGTSSFLYSTNSPQDVVGKSQDSVTFPSANQAVITDEFGNKFALTWDPGRRLYVNSVDVTALALTDHLDGGPATPDIAYLAWSYGLGSSYPAGSIGVDIWVDGNRTPLGQLPQSGSASYAGVVRMTDTAQNFGDGSIAFFVDFDKSSISGSIDGGLPANGLARFTILPAQISAGAFDSNLVSSDVVVSANGLHGRFFGATGNQIGGNFSMTTSSGDVIGIFGAAE